MFTQSLTSVNNTESLDVTQIEDVLVFANPLYGDKESQKPSANSCHYDALNYIRVRYDKNNQQYSTQVQIADLYKQNHKKFQQEGFIYSYSPVVLNYLASKQKIPSGCLDIDVALISLPKLSISLTKQGHDFDVAKLIKEYLTTILTSTKKKFSNPIVTIEDILKEIKIEEYAGTMQRMIDFLQIKFQLNFYDLLYHYFLERTDKEWIINKQIAKNIFQSLSLPCQQAICYDIFNDVQYKQLGISYSYWLPHMNLYLLLTSIKSYGPHVFAIDGKITDLQNIKTWKCNWNGFDIYDIQIKSDPITPFYPHAIVVIGGGSKNGAKYIYYIDPNFGYSYSRKTPIYKMDFEVFQSLLTQAVKGLSLIFSNNKEKVSVPMDTKYGLYGAQGLHVTRDLHPNLLKGDIKFEYRFFKKVVQNHLEERRRVSQSAQEEHDKQFGLVSRS